MTWKSQINSLIRATGRRWGVDIVRFPTLRTEGERLGRLLRAQAVDNVLDVGANAGQYAVRLRERGFRGCITSFEPLPDAFAELERRSAADSRWSCVRLALGARRGEAVLNIAKNSTSSSLRPMLERHVASAPGSIYTSSCTVRLQRLDDVFDEHVSPGDTCLLKIDTQGHEFDVLLGASSSLGRTHGLQLEMSLVPLYDGQMLFSELLEWVQAQGFELHALEPGFSDGASGRLLQVDGIFFRPGRPS